MNYRYVHLDLSENTYILFVCMYGDTDNDIPYHFKLGFMSIFPWNKINTDTYTWESDIFVPSVTNYNEWEKALIGWFCWHWFLERLFRQPELPNLFWTQENVGHPEAIASFDPWRAPTHPLVICGKMSGNLTLQSTIPHLDRGFPGQHFWSSDHIPINIYWNTLKSISTHWNQLKSHWFTRKLQNPKKIN